jgi:putative phosphoribosyl transferase
MGPIFADRTDAGLRLLPPIKAALAKGCDLVVIALPRGGVPVARVIASALKAPLDVVLVRKVGLPGQPELAVAAVTNGQAPEIRINHDVARIAGLSKADIAQLAAPAIAEIARRRAVWDGVRPMVAVAGKTVLVVDDGVATGASMRAALGWLRRQGADRLIVAIPVAPREVLTQLAQDADQVICLATPSPFHAVGAHFADFPQITDAEVTDALAQKDG